MDEEYRKYFLELSERAEKQFLYRVKLRALFRLIAITVPFIVLIVLVAILSPISLKDVTCLFFVATFADILIALLIILYDTIWF
nr:MAG TPA: hypothetical protein [Caudoviricetes sp.]DAX82583.1 MAG TPA: hypothetical protein [Caudoviricetes sp.]